MKRQPRAFIIVSGCGRSLYRDETNDFAPAPPLEHEGDQILVPDVAWVGHYRESQSKLAAVRKTLDARAHLVQIDTGEE